MTGIDIKREWEKHKASKNNPHFSLFIGGIKTTIPAKSITLVDFIEMIKKENPLIQQIREAKTKEERNNLKSKLDYVCFAGIFRRRGKEDLVKSSGFACFDVDDVTNLEEAKEKINKNKYTHCSFISPSGKGLKFLVKIPEIKNDEEYKKYWISISKHYALPNSDVATKDISRACYISEDGGAYYNPNSEVYIEKGEDNTPQEDKNRDTSRSSLEYRRAIALFRTGKTREEVTKELLAYKKFADAPEQYRQITLDKAETFVLDEQDKKVEEKHVATKEEVEFTKDKSIFSKIIKEFNKKIEGEDNSKKAIFLSLCSVWNKEAEVPLNSLVSSESSAGKSFICKNIIKIFPKEMVEYRTKITPEAFTYWKRGEEDWDWDGKICYLEDISQSILDAPTFKVMCSEGSTATIVIKQKAVDIEIKGKPVMLVTTARTNPNTEILNRFQIISLDESKEQTKAIVFRQAEQKNSEKYDENITNALKLLKRKKVYIPYAKNIANYLNKSYNFEAIRLRRDFSRLLDLIKCSAVLHQYQRKEIEKDTIEANEQDYLIASEVINYIQTATFKGLTHKLKKVFECCKELGEFSAKEIHAKHPFVNQKMWYNYLDDLCERGMLTTELKRIEESKKEVTYYKTKEEMNFALPEYAKLLQNITIDTLDTNDTIDTNVTNDNEKEDNNCKKCNNYNDKVQVKEINFENSGIKEQLEGSQK